MTGAIGFAIVAGGGADGARPAHARVEKSRAGNGLHGERRHEAEMPGTVTPCRRQMDLLQYETDAREPLWNGPPLNAAFVAQLLGQVLPRQPAAAPRSASYRFQLRGLALDRMA